MPNGTGRATFAVRMAVTIALVGTVGGRSSPAAETLPATSTARVRSSDPFIAGLIAEASRLSPTFNRLLITVSSTNGIVYVERGKCGRGVRACLQIWMQTAGPNRLLRILLDISQADAEAELMGSIGHELQHATEALTESAVTNGTMLYNFFRRYAPTDGNRFETTEAVNVGNEIRREIEKGRP